MLGKPTSVSLDGVLSAPTEPERAGQRLYARSLKTWIHEQPSRNAERLGYFRAGSALVVTAAIPADHPEIAAARAAGIPVLKRAEALGGIVNGGFVVGIAGTHGKTTTTALTTIALAAAGLDPTGLVGGRVTEWEGNLRFGKSDVYVVEADEYDRSFHALSPDIAVVTTLEADHLDIFGTLEGVEAAGTPVDAVVAQQHAVLARLDRGVDEAVGLQGADVLVVDEDFGLDAARHQ